MNVPLALLNIAVVVTLVFGVLRFVVPVEGKINKKDIFKDLAHIWVGILIGAAVGLTLWWAYGDGLASFPWQCWALAAGITTLEVVAFVVRKGEGDDDEQD